MSIEAEKFKNSLYFQTTVIIAASGQRTIFVEPFTCNATNDGLSLFSKRL